MEMERYHSAAICGFRKKGRKLYDFLRRKGVKVSYILERNYEALGFLEKDMGIPVVGFNESMDFYRQAEVIILSGDLPEDTVKECFGLAGIDVPIMPGEPGWENV